VKAARWLKAVGIGLLCTGIVYWVLVHQQMVDRTLLALQAISLADLWLGGLVCLLSLLVRFARWHWMLGHLGHRPALVFSLRVYIAGIAMTWTPAKLGETLRSALLRTQGVPVAGSLGAFVADRLSDVVGLAALGASAALLASQRQPVLETIVALSLLPSLWLAWRVRRGWTPRLPVRWRPNYQRLSAPLRAWASIWTPAHLPVYAGAAALAYGMQAAVFAAFASALVPDLGMLQCIIWFALAIFVGAACLVPAGLGAMEAALALQLNQHGVAWPEAIAVTLATRLVTLWVPSLLGALTMLTFARPGPHLAADALEGKS